MESHKNDWGGMTVMESRKNDWVGMNVMESRKNDWGGMTVMESRKNDWGDLKLDSLWSFIGEMKDHAENVVFFHVFGRLSGLF